MFKTEGATGYLLCFAFKTTKCMSTCAKHRIASLIQKFLVAYQNQTIKMPSLSMFRAVSLLILLALFHTSVKSQATNRNLTSTGCSDANSYTTCSETAAGKAQVCLQQGSQSALAACVCINYIEMMNCYMANCWNRVSSLAPSTQPQPAVAPTMKSHRIADDVPLEHRFTNANTKNTPSSIYPNARAIS